MDVLLQSYQVIGKLFDGFVFKLDTGTLPINSTGTKSLPQVYTSQSNHFDICSCFAIDSKIGSRKVDLLATICTGT